MRQFFNPAEEALLNCLRFVYTSTGDVKHSGETSTDDPTAARVNHGDQVIADALLNMILEILGSQPKLPEKSYEPQEGSFEWRFRRGTEADRQAELEWV